MKGSDVIAELKKKFRVTSDARLSELTGLSVPAIQLWKKREECTARQIAGLVHGASKRGAVRCRESALRPLVEFFRVDSCASNQGKSCVLFDWRDDDGGIHPYDGGLKVELQSKHGVYIFFDSRGQAIYAGKAKRQSLWDELNSALNRDRPEVQKIRRVYHPGRRQEYRTSDEKARQIVEQKVRLAEMACYFSAYEVDLDLIDDVEALLVRSFANDLLNARMERFARHRKTRR